MKAISPVRRGVAGAALLILIGGMTMCYGQSPKSDNQQMIKQDSASGAGRSGGTAIARAAGPVSLGAGPVAISLVPTPESTPGQTLASLLPTLAPEQRVYLVIRDLSTDEQPGVLYHVYLDLAPGSHPGKDDPHYAGTLNFFNAGKINDAEKRRGPAIFRSFDITELSRKLQKQKLLLQETTITIVPVDTPKSEAKPVIGRIELAVQ